MFLVCKLFLTCFFMFYTHFIACPTVKLLLVVRGRSVSCLGRNLSKYTHQKTLLWRCSCLSIVTELMVILMLNCFCKKLYSECSKQNLSSWTHAFFYALNTDILGCLYGTALPLFGCGLWRCFIMCMVKKKKTRCEGVKMF